MASTDKEEAVVYRGSLNNSQGIPLSGCIGSLLIPYRSQGLHETHLSLEEVNEIILFYQITKEEDFFRILDEIGKQEKVNMIVPSELLAISTPYEDAGASLKDSKKIWSTKKKESEDFSKLADSIYRELLTYYSGYLTDGKTSEKALASLAQTLCRVPKGKWESEKKSVMNMTPERLYLWAVSKANIAFPYLNLKEASERVKTAINLPPEWGYDGKRTWHLPRKESIGDSNWWMFLFYILEDLIPENHTIEYVDFVESMPMLDNDEVEKNQDIAVILHRIVELSKSPSSATLRSGDALKDPRSSTKNIVDMELVEKFHQSEYCKWKNLSYSPEAVAALRRGRKVPETIMVKGRPQLSERTILLGSKLSQLCGMYLSKKSKAEPENEPFYKLISDMLSLLVGWIPETWEPATRIFVKPSHYVKMDIRRGPKIKTKDGGVRTNAYIPFSFVKSAECELYPSLTRQELTSLGSKINNELDKVNNFSVINGSKMIPHYKKMLQVSYTVSDEIRKRWRSSASVPRNVSEIKDTFEELIFPLFDSPNWSELEDLHLAKAARNLLDIDFVRFSDKEEDIMTVKAKVTSTKENKRRKRVTSD